MATIPMSDPSIPVATYTDAIADTMLIEKADVTSLTGYRTKRTHHFASIMDASLGDGVTDCTSAVNAALAALPATGGCIYFPPGKYKFNSKITFTFPNSLCSVSFCGAGKDVSILSWTNASGGIEFDLVSDLNSVHIHDLSFTTQTTNGGNAIALINSFALGTFPGSSVSNVFIGGDNRHALSQWWTTGILVQGVSGVDIDSVMIYGQSAGASGNGIFLIGGVNSPFYMIVVNIINSTFLSVGAGLVIETQVQGVTVTNCVFTNGTTAINVPSGTGLTQLNVTSCEFNVLSNGIVTTVQYGNIFVTDCLFFVATGTSGIYLINNNVFKISGCVFAALSVGAGLGVTIGTSQAGSRSVIVDNILENLLTGVDLLAGSQGCSVQNNNFINCTTPISNSGTVMTISDNPGYNPVGVSAAANVGTSPATITAGPSPETHYLNQSATNTATVAKSTRTVAALKDASTYYTIELGPNESYVVTWATTQPTYTKDVH